MEILVVPWMVGGAGSGRALGEKSRVVLGRFCRKAKARGRGTLFGVEEFTAVVKKLKWREGGSVVLLVAGFSSSRRLRVVFCIGR